jgi:hypothetical protein
MKLWNAYLNPTPKNVIKWLLGIKGIIATCAGSAYFAGNDKAAFWMLVAGGVLNELVNILEE